MKAEALSVVSGISQSFDWLSRTRRYVTYVLLTRAPVYSGAEAPFLPRLACVRHAASVRSEPGSNSPVETGAMTNREIPHRHELTSKPHARRVCGSLCRLLSLARERGTLLFSFQRPTGIQTRTGLIATRIFYCQPEPRLRWGRTASLTLRSRFSCSPFHVDASGRRLDLARPPWNPSSEIDVVTPERQRTVEVRGACRPPLRGNEWPPAHAQRYLCDIARTARPHRRSEPHPP